MKIDLKKIFPQSELRDVLISVLIAALIFAYDHTNPVATVTRFPVFLVVVIFTFLFHELAHRFVARKLGCASFYKIWLQGIIFGLLFMLVGIKFLALGAVVIYPYMFGRWGFRVANLTIKEIGIIGFSGIAVNLILATVFKPFAGVLVIWGLDVFGIISSINAWFAFFNLLPVKPLDGSKILTWKAWFWLVLIVYSILLLFI